MSKKKLNVKELNIEFENLNERIRELERDKMKKYFMKIRHTYKHLKTC